MREKDRETERERQKKRQGQGQIDTERERGRKESKGIRNDAKVEQKSFFVADRIGISGV